MPPRASAKAAGESTPGTPRTGRSGRRKTGSEFTPERSPSRPPGHRTPTETPASPVYSNLPSNPIPPPNEAPSPAPMAPAGVPVSAFVAILAMILLFGARDLFPASLSLPFVSSTERLAMKEMMENSAGFGVVRVHPNLRLSDMVARGPIFEGEPLVEFGLGAALCARNVTAFPDTLKIFVQAYMQGTRREPPDHVINAVRYISELALGPRSQFRYTIQHLARQAQATPPPAFWSAEDFARIEVLGSEYSAAAVAAKEAYEENETYFKLIVEANADSLPSEFFTVARLKEGYAFAARGVLTNLGSGLGECLAVPFAGVEAISPGALEPYSIVDGSVVRLTAARNFTESEAVGAAGARADRKDLFARTGSADVGRADTIVLTLQDAAPHVDALVTSVLGLPALSEQPYSAQFPADELRSGLLAAEPMRVLRSKFISPEQAAMPEVQRRLAEGEVVTLEVEREVLRALRGVAEGEVASMATRAAAHADMRATAAAVQVLRVYEAKVQLFTQMLRALEKHWAALL